tara:strand:+ start:2428 stop:3330 length:903 start_codon:yes stop_codon:yes gene_type:complete
MLYINLGLPKSGSTLLQNKLYPFLKNIHYMGRFKEKKNSQLLVNLTDFIENRREFSKSDFSSLVLEFKNYYLKHKKILISHENWMVPYDKNHRTLKMQLVSQTVKLQNLMNFLNKVDIKFKFFFIQRDLEISIQSFYSTLNTRIVYLFGEKFLDFDYFLNYIYNKQENYEKLLLLINVFNFKEIKKIIPENTITIFKYDDIETNNEKFITNLSNYLEIPTDPNLFNQLSDEINSSFKEGKDYKFLIQNKLYRLIKICSPQFILNYKKFFLRSKFINFILYKKILVNDKRNTLKKIIKEYF